MINTNFIYTNLKIAIAVNLSFMARYYLHSLPLLPLLTMLKSQRSVMIGNVTVLVTGKKLMIHCKLNNTKTKLFH